jgi:hypothetical protein
MRMNTNAFNNLCNMLEVYTDVALFFVEREREREKERPNKI